eukprot:5939686-Pleurochrysis_carterae.AAC.1
MTNFNFENDARRSAVAVSRAEAALQQGCGKRPCTRRKRGMDGLNARASGWDGAHRGRGRRWRR